LIKGKHVLSIPNESISKITYLENKRIYGMGFQLIKPLPRKIVIYELQSFNQQRSKEFECDLFFPFFSQRSVNALLEEITF
jgi:hypothetical protein